MGNLDRAIRLLIGLALLYISLMKPDLIANHTVRYLLIVMGALNIVSGSFAFCPLYTLADINTRRRHVR
jgi:hypothetical protein